MRYHFSGCNGVGFSELPFQSPIQASGGIMNIFGQDRMTEPISVWEFIVNQYPVPGRLGGGVRIYGSDPIGKMESQN